MMKPWAFAVSILALAALAAAQPAGQGDADELTKLRQRVKELEAAASAPAAESKPDVKAPPAPKPATKPAPAPKPATKAAPAPKPEPVQFSDEAVEKAIQRGIAYLVSQRTQEGNWASVKFYEHNYAAGPTALATYALLTAGVSVQDPGMAKTLEWLKTAEDQKTYSVGLRANVWLLANRTGGNQYAKELRDDVALLIQSTANGSYYYDSAGKPAARADNSNSQYGLLGVWAGAQGGLEIPSEYWQKVQKHWQGSQDKDGGWSYYPGRSGSTATMTAAGLASLFVCSDNLNRNACLTCGATDANALPISRGMEWLGKNFAASVKGYPNTYYLYGLERVALAGGYKYIGDSDWYKLGATQLLLSQGKNGEWLYGRGNQVIGTSFALLFLCRGRHPVLFNKMEFDGDWNNRPRALASLTQWLGKSFERTVNWQIIKPNVPVSEWQDAPILYLSGAKKMKFTDEEVEKLRRYVWQGGTIFSATECAGEGFAKDIRQLYQRLFPGCDLVRIKSDHPLYGAQFRVRGDPRLYVVSNGVRLLAIHSDQDLARSWQVGAGAGERAAFEIMANVYLYVTDRGVLQPRGTNQWPLEAATQSVETIRLARLKHGGPYDPEPLAYERFARLFTAKAPRKLEVLPPMPVAELPKAEARVATLTGTAELVLTAEEQATLKTFVAAGGTLVIDAAGGSASFDASARNVLAQMYGPEALRRIPLNHAIYLNPLPGAEDLAVREVRYRRATRVRLGANREPGLLAIFVGDRPAVIYSREDITAGLVGYQTLGLDGYDGGDGRDVGSAYRILRNIILYASGEKTASAPAKAGTAP